MILCGLVLFVLVILASGGCWPKSKKTKKHVHGPRQLPYVTLAVILILHLLQLQWGLRYWDRFIGVPKNFLLSPSFGYLKGSYVRRYHMRLICPVEWLECRFLYLWVRSDKFDADFRVESRFSRDGSNLQFSRCSYNFHTSPSPNTFTMASKRKIGQNVLCASIPEFYKASHWFVAIEWEQDSLTQDCHVSTLHLSVLAEDHPDKPRWDLPVINTMSSPLLCSGQNDSLFHDSLGKGTTMEIMQTVMSVIRRRKKTNRQIKNNFYQIGNIILLKIAIDTSIEFEVCYIRPSVKR